MINGLSQVGADPDRRREVDDSRKHILSFSRFGAEWKARVGRLLEVLSAPQLMAAEKLVAYGALFYLINPFDLIPDAIPVIGYFDDFAVLGIAVWYYNRLLSRRRAARGEAPPPASE
ncbi:MAG: DUF1232 domain-containing protein [Elusimicrobia bacterium]|nr:DUF1232 domain-containing protein [Elusimicrobiota bacterium]